MPRRGLRRRRADARRALGVRDVGAVRRQRVRHAARTSPRGARSSRSGRDSAPRRRPAGCRRAAARARRSSRAYLTHRPPAAALLARRGEHDLVAGALEGGHQPSDVDAVRGPLRRRVRVRDDEDAHGTGVLTESRVSDSNRRHLPYKRSALPAELTRPCSPIVHCGADPCAHRAARRGSLTRESRLPYRACTRGTPRNLGGSPHGNRRRHRSRSHRSAHGARRSPPELGDERLGTHVRALAHGHAERRALLVPGAQPASRSSSSAGSARRSGTSTAPSTATSTTASARWCRATRTR